jgi:membrane protein
VDAKPSYARNKTAKQGSTHGLITPLIAYALGSLLATTSKESNQRNHTKTIHCQSSGSEPNATAARHSSEVPAEAKAGGRGRTASTPWEIPWTGWKDILWRTYGQIGEDRLLAVAAGVVFYGLLALFPAVTAFVSLYGFFAQASGINEHLSLVAGVLPEGAVQIIQEQVTRIASKGETRLTLAFAFGLALALWSANAGMKALIDALNVSYDEEEKRGFIKLNLVSLALTVGAIVAILIAVGAVIVVPIVLSYLELGGWVQTFLSLLRWPVLLLLVIFADDYDRLALRAEHRAAGGEA